MDSFVIIDNYFDISMYLKHIEISGYINLSQNTIEPNILIIYFEKDLLTYFNTIANLYNGKIKQFHTYKQVIYSISLYDIYILEYLSTFYVTLNQKRNTKLYNSYVYLYNNQLKYLNTKKCNEIQYLI